MANFQCKFVFWIKSIIYDNYIITVNSCDVIARYQIKKCCNDLQSSNILYKLQMKIKLSNYGIVGEVI